MEDDRNPCSVERDIQAQRKEAEEQTGLYRLTAKLQKLQRSGATDCSAMEPEIRAYLKKEREFEATMGTGNFFIHTQRAEEIDDLARLVRELGSKDLAKEIFGVVLDWYVKAADESPDTDDPRYMRKASYAAFMMGDHSRSIDFDIRAGELEDAEETAANHGLVDYILEHPGSDVKQTIENETREIESWKGIDCGDAAESHVNFYEGLRPVVYAALRKLLPQKYIEQADFHEWSASDECEKDCPFENEDITVEERENEILEALEIASRSWKRAAELSEELGEPDTSLWRSAGYASERLGNFEDAIGFYIKAEAFSQAERLSREHSLLEDTVAEAKASADAE
ncbi:hypothetical protein KY362_06910 [Candidatus Woesearchaeota archaeon]|nr:hypothetical protein [Candidatus Woesearchaeota archaeon]